MSYTLYHRPYSNAPLQQVVECTLKPYAICMKEKQERMKVKRGKTESYHIFKHK